MALITSRFEVNTDIALIDPDWDAFADAHERRYGLAIAYVKSCIKGTSYGNKVMDLVVGKRGFYVQSRHFPAAFYGETAEVRADFVDEAEAQAACWEAVAHYRAGEAQSLTCLYGEAPMDIFFGYRLEHPERFEMGALAMGLPLHLRLMLDAPTPSALLGDRKGVLIYQRTRDGRHLLIRAPGSRQPFPLLDGFGD
jgi:hypothetical protein